MFKDMTELAENKLLLLYIFCELDIPVSNSQITQIVLENNLINYFSLQQYLSELTESGFLKNDKRDNHTLLIITPTGKETLRFFINRVPEKKKELIDEYIKSCDLKAKNKVEALSDFVPDGKDSFVVSLKILNDSNTDLEIRIPVSSREEARRICNLWKKKYAEVHSSIKEKLNISADE